MNFEWRPQENDVRFVSASSLCDPPTVTEKCDQKPHYDGKCWKNGVSWECTYVHLLGHIRDTLNYSFTADYDMYSSLKAHWDPPDDRAWIEHDCWTNRLPVAWGAQCQYGTGSIFNVGD